MAWPLAARADVEADLTALAQAAPGEPRLQAAKALAPHPVAELVSALKKKREASVESLRALLKSIRAEVPNTKGTFEQPPRPKDPNAPELDWLAELARQPIAAGAAQIAQRDALATVALLRALATAGTEAAADAILDFGFTADGLVFRDECGRQLRAMAPASLPTLLRASQDKKREGGNYARYANYQLDRLSMNRPSYALSAATNDALEVAILHAIAEVRHPDAVTAVLDRIDAPSNSVRKAARDAWMAYVTGPEPPPAPKAYRKLPGGKHSKEPMPLYLTYRELAEQELRRVLLELTGTEPTKKATAAEMTKTLLDLYDQRHAKKGDEVVAAAAADLAAGKWIEVGARYDALIRDEPLYAHRAQLVPGYLGLGRMYAEQRKWDEAALAFDKAYSLDPTGENAKEAQKGLFAARAAKSGATEQSGDENAAQAEPRSLGPDGIAVPPAPARHRSWLLYIGLAGCGFGLLLLLLGLATRKRA